VFSGKSERPAPIGRERKALGVDPLTELAVTGDAAATQTPLRHAPLSLIRWQSFGDDDTPPQPLEKPLAIPDFQTIMLPLLRLTAA
jgi:hypothetical protein